MAAYNGAWTLDAEASDEAPRIGEEAPRRGAGLAARRHAWMADEARERLQLSDEQVDQLLPFLRESFDSTQAVPLADC